MNDKNYIPHRIFWSWDHSTNWCLHSLGAQNCGVSNAYAKAPEMFEKDYMRVIDFCAEHKFDAVGIVALLRNKHGGVDSARRVCDYGLKKGVKVYIISGLYSYGGVYYDGDHKYSLDRFFRNNPDCVGKTETGEPLVIQYDGKYGYNPQAQGCPSNAKLHEFALESLDWLFKEIPELGGIQMESGDSGVCQCPECQRRRGGYAQHISVSDMAGIYPDASEVVLKRNPDALVICETYHHFKDEPCKFFESDDPSPDHLKLYNMSDKVRFQWKCDVVLRDNTWFEGDQMLPHLQKFNHVMRSHAGTQWWGGRASFDVDKIRRQCRLSFLSGFDTVSMFGENATFHTNAEFNYLAMEYFADHPLNSNEDFIRDVMGPLLGGADKAAFYFESARLFEDDPHKIPDASAKIAKIASGITDYETLRRWQYLASNLNGYYWEAIKSGEAVTMTDGDKIGDLNKK